MEEAYRHTLCGAVDLNAGLYEIVWGIHTWFPDETEAACRTAAEAAVRHYLALGWIRLSRWTVNDPRRVPLRVDEVEAALACVDYWAVSAEGYAEMVTVELTDAGTAAYDDPGRGHVRPGPYR